MKHFLLRVVIIAICMSCLNHLQAHVALDYPQGSETFIQGQTVVITWHTVQVHNTLNWDLYFSTNSGDTWEPLLLDISPDSVSHTWVVPYISTTHARIRVIQDNTEMDYPDFSMDFSIVPNTAPPSLDAPAVNITIPCNVAQQQNIIQAWLNNNGGASVSNNCGELIWSNDYPGLTNGCAATGSALVTFSASDECGSTESFATVTVIDNVAPVISIVPINMTVSCNGQGNVAAFTQWLNTHGGAQATDGCGNMVWTHNNPSLNDGCGSTGSAIAIFRVTDECGNSTSATASFTITDTTAPTIQAAASDITISCNASSQQSITQWLTNQGGASAVDGCGNVSWTNNYSSLTLSYGSAGNATVIFTAADECGNQTTTQATVSVIDNSPPFIDMVARDTTIICGDPNQSAILAQWLNQHAGAHATDLCGSVSWTDDYTASDSCFDTNLKITFTITDDCGNSATISATLFTIDTTSTPIDNDTTLFAPLGATWYYNASSGSPPWIADPLYGLFLAEKDTFMLGRDARIISYFKNDDGELVRQQDLTRYVATEGQKVFYKVGDEFVLLYDFGAHVGDTIQSKAEPIAISLGCNDLDSIVSFSYIIDSIFTIYIDGQQVIAQDVTSLHTDGQNWGFFEGSLILERIGFAGWGAFWFGGGIDGCILEAGYLRCYTDPDINWRSSFFDANAGCAYTETHGPSAIEEVMIYPNPAYDRISLSVETESIRVYNLLGEKFDLVPSGHDWLISSLPAGIYLLECKVEDQGRVGRFVKMN